MGHPDLNAILGMPPDPCLATSTADEEAKYVKTTRRSRQAEWADDKKKFERIQAEGIGRDPTAMYQVPLQSRQKQDRSRA